MQSHLRILNLYNDSASECDDTPVAMIKSDQPFEISTGDRELFISFQLDDVKWILEIHSEIKNS